jgi:hypothetical protein
MGPTVNVRINECFVEIANCLRACMELTIRLEDMRLWSAAHVVLQVRNRDRHRSEVISK